MNTFRAIGVTVLCVGCTGQSAIERRFDNLAYAITENRPGISDAYDSLRLLANEKGVARTDSTCGGTIEDPFYRFVCLLKTNEQDNKVVKQVAEGHNVPLKVEQVQKFKVRIIHRFFSERAVSASLVGTRLVEGVFSDVENLEREISSALPEPGEIFSDDQVLSFYRFLIRSFPGLTKTSLLRESQSSAACKAEIDIYVEGLVSEGWIELPTVLIHGLPFKELVRWPCWGDLGAVIERL